MQADRSAGAAREAGSVRGLGVCDVLRVELDPLQRAVLERRLAAGVEALEARRAILETDAGNGATCEELGDVAHELRVLARIRAALPACPQARFALVGPAGLVSALIAACLAEAVACLERRLAGRPATAVSSPALEPELRVAGAWIATALDCAAVEGFCLSERDCRAKEIGARRAAVPIASMRAKLRRLGASAHDR